MYELLGRCAQRPWSTPSPRLVPAPNSTASSPLILHMRENRSHLSQEARTCFSAIAVLFMVASIAPALHGQWLVPAYAIIALAGLTFALERHARARPASETLELADGRVRHRDSLGQRVEYPAFWMRLAAESKNPADLRLFLRGRDGQIEFGRCLSLDERREVAPLVAAALAQARGC
jgi:uncharacterized membrane protein